MYERFSDRARKVMQLANQEAQGLNHEYVGTEHMLLGLIREGSGIACNVLRNLKADTNAVVVELKKLIQPGPECVTMGKLPQTPRAKKVIELAMEQARHLNHNHVGTEHLLLGLLKEKEGIAYQVLDFCGVKFDAVLAGVNEVVGITPSPAKSEWGKVTAILQVRGDNDKSKIETARAVFHELCGVRLDADEVATYKAALAVLRRQLEN